MLEMMLAIEVSWTGLSNEMFQHQFCYDHQKLGAACLLVRLLKPFLRKMKRMKFSMFLSLEMLRNEQLPPISPMASHQMAAQVKVPSHLMKATMSHYLAETTINLLMGIANPQRILLVLPPKIKPVITTVQFQITFWREIESTKLAFLLAKVCFNFVF
jgi:hypothetical protein